MRVSQTPWDIRMYCCCSCVGFVDCFVYEVKITFIKDNYMCTTFLPFV